MVFQIRPLANGLRTDHPVPGLPFVDDSHIPIDEGGEAIEAVGRNKGRGMWGREDPNHADGGWHAFTTDPINTDLAWAVRYHPDHGRTVLLVRDDDAAVMHTEWSGSALLFRAGGYWWDGTAWYRPGQVWDPVKERYEHRPARAAVTVTAAHLLDRRTDPDRAQVMEVTSFDTAGAAPQNWVDHLALWSKRRAETDSETLELSECVVNLSCPELTGDQLLGVPEMAAVGEISASTLRAYISRGESSVPLPQATVGGRSMWSVPVVEDWAESRRRSAEGVTAVMTAGDRDELSPGAAAVRDRFAEEFRYSLWERPDIRKRWVLRHRNEESAREVADRLAWTVAVSLDNILPTEILGPTILHAVLDEFAWAVKRIGRRQKPNEEMTTWELPVTRPVAKMLDWFVRHHPRSAQWTIGEILREANDRWNLNPQEAGEALRRALAMAGDLDETVRDEFFARVLPTEPAS